MSAFLERLRQQVGFHGIGNQAMDRESPDSVEEDQEMDGYLLVGDSFSERAGNVSSQASMDAPPTYRQISEDGLPSYDYVISGNYTEVLSSDQRPQTQFVPMSPNRSPICDIPFQLHPSLSIGQRIGALLEGIDLQPQRFNWAKYSYNFNHEHLCLRELSCHEEVDISEFSQRSTDSSTPTDHAHNEERDLMTF